MLPWTADKKHPLPQHPFWLAAFFRPVVLSSHASFQREFVQTDILNRRPDDRQATGLGGEHVDLIGALPHKTLQTLNGIGRLDRVVHGRRKLVKGQQVLFIFSQTSHRLWIAFAVFGFEGR